MYFWCVEIVVEYDVVVVVLNGDFFVIVYGDVFMLICVVGLGYVVCDGFGIV